MHECLIKLHTVYDKLLENQIGRLEPGLSKDALIEKYRLAVSAQDNLRNQLNSIVKNDLEQILLKMDKLDVATEEDLFNLAQKLSSYANRLDPGLALKIYKKLLELARQNNDDEKIIKYLYWCGITSFYMPSARNSRKHHEQTAAYFEEGSSYALMYDELENPETRQYIHRCIGNKCMVYYHLYDRHEVVKEEEKAFSFWNSIIFSGKDLDFPWPQYFMTCYTHRQNEVIHDINTNMNNYSKENAYALLKICITIFNIYNKNRNLYEVFGSSRYEFMLWRAQFLAGLISFEHLQENVERMSAKFSNDDCSTDALFAKIQAKEHLITYVAGMEKLAYKKDEFYSGMLKDTLERLLKLPMTLTPAKITELMQGFAVNIGPYMDPDGQIEVIFSLTSHRHIQLYAHGVIVGYISSLLTRSIAKLSPGYFAGCLGIPAAADVSLKIDELSDFANVAGLCHDIGAIYYATNPFITARERTDDEFELIYQHPADGAKLLERADASAVSRGYRDVILGHHKYYDNSGGYPEDFDPRISENKMIIDIVAISNVLANLTDDIGKPYNAAMNIRDACNEIMTRAGSEFSPVVAHFLTEKSIIAELEKNLENERVTAYYSAYLRAWEM